MKIYLKSRIGILKDLYNQPFKSYPYQIALRTRMTPYVIYRELKKMKSEGLICISKEERHQNPQQRKKYYKLTPEGKKLAELFYKIEEIYKLLPLKN